MATVVAEMSMSLDGFVADATPVHLENPRVVEGVGVTHLDYRVR
jgi:hypothetical protein